MSNLGINFENVLSIKKQLNKPLKEVFSLLKTNGISSLDIAYDKVKNPVYLSEILSAGFDISTVFYMADLGKKDNYTTELEIVDFCAFHKIGRIFLITKPEYDGNNGDYVKFLIQNLKRIVKYAKNYSVQICIENFGVETSPYSTVERVKFILKKVKGLNLVFDTGNFVLAGESPLNCLNQLKEFISSVHLKDRGKTLDDTKFISLDVNGEKTCVYPLGEGDSEILEVVKELNSLNKEFDYCLEFDFKNENVLDDLMKSAIYYATELKNYE